MSTPDATGGWCSPPWCVVVNDHHPDRETCSACWPYWGEYLVRTAPRVQCEELHAHHAHSWQFSGQPTNMCPGRATCDASVTTIELRELPPLGGPVSAHARAQVQRLAEQLGVPLAELPETGGHYSQWEDRQWQERVWKAGVDAGLFNDGTDG